MVQGTEQKKPEQERINKLHNYLTGKRFERSIDFGGIVYKGHFTFTNLYKHKEGLDLRLDIHMWALVVTEPQFYALNRGDLYWVTEYIVDMMWRYYGVSPTFIEVCYFSKFQGAIHNSGIGFQWA